MTGILEYLFGAASFMPHGYCLLWRPDLVALHAVSDGIVSLAYFSIPVAIFLFLKKRADFEFKHTANLFALFIALCGLTHLIGLVTLWQPVYGLQGVVKAATAIVSVVTAIALWPLLPKLLALPGPNQLRQVNRDLLEEIDHRLHVELELTEAHKQMGLRVDERTAEVAAEQTRLRDALEAISEGFVLWDAQGQLVYVNRRFNEIRPDLAPILEESPTSDEFRRRAFQIRKPDASKTEINEYVKNLGTVRKVQEFHLTHLNPDKWITLETNVTSDGGHVSIVTDITREKISLLRLEQQTHDLLASEERYRALFDLSPNATFVTDKGVMKLCNPATENLLTYSADELLGFETIDRIVHSSSREAALQRRKNRAKGLPTGPLNLQLVRSDGSNIDVELLGTEITWEGRPAMLNIAQDITDRLRTERMLEERAKQLERSNRDLEQFAYIASHDLQAPLRTVASYCSLLSRRYADKLDDDGRKFIEFAVEGAARLQEQIRGILAFSRVGRSEDNFEPVDLNDVFRRVCDSLRKTAEDSEATIKADDLPTVRGRAPQLEQLLQNLIENGLKYRRQCKPEINISAERLDTGWRISVADNGIGFDIKYVDRIFQMFQRLNLREDYAGTGIGLAMCRKIVEGHGGELTAESQEGAGSTFHFTLHAA